MIRLAMVALLMATTASAHRTAQGWTYDPTCCDAVGQNGPDTGDCAVIPGERVTETRTGYVVRLLPGDHPIVPNGDVYVFRWDEIRSDGRPKIRRAPDGEWHACVVPGYGYCLYHPDFGS